MSHNNSDTDDSLEDLFIHSKPVSILTRIYGNGEELYASSISSEVDSTYAHTVKILQRMEGLDLIEFTKKDRRKIVNLTDEGRRLADHFADLTTEMAAQLNR